MPDLTWVYDKCHPSPSDGSLTMASVPSLGPLKTTRDTVIRMADLSQTQGFLRHERPPRRPFLLQVPQKGRSGGGNACASSLVASSVTVGCGSSSDSCSSEIKQIFTKDERELCNRRDHQDRNKGEGLAVSTGKRPQDGRDKNPNHHRSRELNEEDDEYHRRQNQREYQTRSSRSLPHIEGPRTWVLLIFVLCFLIGFFTIWIGMMMAIVKRLNPNVY